MQIVDFTDFTAKLPTLGVSELLEMMCNCWSRDIPTVVSLGSHLPPHVLKWNYTVFVVLDGDIQNPKRRLYLCFFLVNDRWQAVFNPQPVLPVPAGSA